MAQAAKPRPVNHASLDSGQQLHRHRQLIKSDPWLEAARNGTTTSKNQQPPRTYSQPERAEYGQEHAGNRNRVPTLLARGVRPPTTVATLCSPWRSLVVALGALVSLGMDSRRPCWRLSPCPLPGQDDARDSRVILTRGIHSRPILPRKNAQSCSPLGPDPEPPVSLPPTNPAAGRHQQCQRTPRAAAVVAAFPGLGTPWYAWNSVRPASRRADDLGTPPSPSTLDGAATGWARWLLELGAPWPPWHPSPCSPARATGLTREEQNFKLKFTTPCHPVRTLPLGATWRGLGMARGGPAA